MFEIYTKSACPICDQAKKILTINCIPYDEYRIGTDITREEVLAKFPGATLAPIMMLNGQQLGGIPELQKLVEDNLI
jgi:glutaredoxin 3